MKFSWSYNSIILGVVAIALLLGGVFADQPGIAKLGVLFLVVASFACGAAYIEEKARRKKLSKSVVA